MWKVGGRRATLAGGSSSTPHAGVCCNLRLSFSLAHPAVPSAFSPSPHSDPAPGCVGAGIKAVIKEGVLRLTVPKTGESKHKQIDVQVSE